MAAASFHCGELARLTGVGTDTIRHYERLGILPRAPRTPSGYRMHASESIERVQLGQRALQLGFTLAELSEILGVRDQGGVPCHRVLHMTEQKLRSLGRQIENLRQTQRYTRKLVRRWHRQLKITPCGQKADLLHSLATDPDPELQPLIENCLGGQAHDQTICRHPDRLLLPLGCRALPRTRTLLAPMAWRTARCISSTGPLSLMPR
jgi:DNA-binding transcriptional MerR regulator